MRFKLASLLSVSLILTACGSADSAIDGAQNIPNLFGNTVNSLDDFSSSSTGDSSNARGLEANQLRVTMEVPVNYAPDGEPTRRNLRIVIPDQIQVYQTNHSLQKLDNIDYTTATGDDGHFILTFNNGLPIGPDVVIEATWNGGKGITMKALAADSDRDVKVNPFSHYLVEEILGQHYGADEFQTVMDCVNDVGGGLCLNKYVWSTLADQVHDFEIEIGSNASLDSALTTLRERVDFATYVDNLANYALLGESNAGSISASSADYNSVFFGLELGETFRSDGDNTAGQWGLRTAQEEDLTDNKAEAFLYPALTLTRFNAFGLDVTSLATDIPYDRQTVAHTTDNRFITEAWRPNTHSSSPGAATVTPKDSAEGTARLLAGRALYQSITYKDAGQTIGWTRNPYYLDAYTTAPESDTTGPDRVISGYFTAGKAIALDEQGGKLRRSDTLENHYLSAFELHLLRSENFDLAEVEGDYNLVYLAGSFGSTEVAFKTGYGSLNTGTATERTVAATVSNTGSFAVSRDENGTVSTSPAASWPDNVQITNRLSLLSSGSSNIGRLSLCEHCLAPDMSGADAVDVQKPDIGQGAATPDGSLLAFNLDDSVWGDGLLIAGKTTSTPLPQNGQYRLQGVIVSMAENSNELYQVNNGVLELSSGNATLTANTFKVSHRISDSQIVGPETYPLSENFDFTTSMNAITSTNSHTVFNGFYTGNADQIFLVLEDDSPANPRTGLLIATLIPE
ncbi:hypothetical protein [Marinobacter sp.]|uniref:hypothetical protein n=1 Tax=Marinobacter sp. TaxID=50741 RepID=UPI003561EE3A